MRKVYILKIFEDKPNTWFTSDEVKIEYDSLYTDISSITAVRHKLRQLFLSRKIMRKRRNDRSYGYSYKLITR